MAVSEHDRQAFARQRAALVAHEETEEMTGPERARVVALTNAWRRAHGISDLRDEADRPEQGFHERARARGLSDRVRPAAP